MAHRRPGTGRAAIRQKAWALLGTIAEPAASMPEHRDGEAVMFESSSASRRRPVRQPRSQPRAHLLSADLIARVPTCGHAAKCLPPALAAQAQIAESHWGEGSQPRIVVSRDGIEDLVASVWENPYVEPGGSAIGPDTRPAIFKRLAPSARVLRLAKETLVAVGWHDGDLSSSAGSPPSPDGASAWLILP